METEKEQRLRDREGMEGRKKREQRGMDGGRPNVRQKQEVRKERCSNPGRRGEKGEPMLTPLCLSQVGNDGRGVEGMRTVNKGTGALKKHNMVISSFHLTSLIHSEVTGPPCSQPVSLHLR